MSRKFGGGTYDLALSGILLYQAKRFSVVKNKQKKYQKSRKQGWLNHAKSYCDPDNKNVQWRATKKVSLFNISKKKDVQRRYKCCSLFFFSSISEKICSKTLRMLFINLFFFK